MKITEKIELIKDITNVLYEKYDTEDLKMFFNHYDLKIMWENYSNGYNEHYEINIKETLSNASDNILINISQELNTGDEYIIKSFPQNWDNSQNKFKIFISHLTENKETAKIIKESLSSYNIDCFVAHEDILPSLEWQDEIFKALQTMDAFISLHCDNFSKSIWCQQEVGAAIIKNVKIIPIKFDGKEDPQGFIGKFQGLSRGSKDRNALAKEIIDILKQDSKTKDLYNRICDLNDNFMAEDEIPF